MTRIKPLATILAGALITTSLTPVAANAATLTKNGNGTCQVKLTEQEQNDIDTAITNRAPDLEYAGLFKIDGIYPILAEYDEGLKNNQLQFEKTFAPALMWEAAQVDPMKFDDSKDTLKISNPAPVELTEFLDSLKPLYPFVEKTVGKESLDEFRRFNNRAGLYGMVPEITSLTEDQIKALVALTYIKIVRGIDSRAKDLPTEVFANSTGTQSYFPNQRAGWSGFDPNGHISTGLEKFNDHLPSFSVGYQRVLAQACREGSMEFEIPKIVDPVIVQREHSTEITIPSTPPEMPPLPPVPPVKPSEVVPTTTTSSAAPTTSAKPSKPAPTTSTSKPSKPAPTTSSSKPSKPTPTTTSAKPNKPAPTTSTSKPSKPSKPTPTTTTRKPSKPSKPTPTTTTRKPSKPSKPTPTTTTRKPSKPTPTTTSAKPNKPAPTTSTSKPSKPSKPAPTTSTSKPSKPTPTTTSAKPSKPSKPTEAKPSTGLDTGAIVGIVIAVLAALGGIGAALLQFVPNLRHLIRF
ncbi:hypothetical protein [Corynebacterium phocae]|uniref:hypothetical protein n=1 Tax=Corynebacterium phocae TaxID=161895 RepID=UPI0012ED37BF|nr:hypothetical protein [Corynebacterium phocae]